jgi:hypothetical protein
MMTDASLYKGHSFGFSPVYYNTGLASHMFSTPDIWNGVLIENGYDASEDGTSFEWLCCKSQRVYKKAKA